jgi:hypothetical protein
MARCEQCGNDHPVLARRTKFAAWLVAVAAISFCWFIG